MRAALSTDVRRIVTPNQTQDKHDTMSDTTPTPELPVELEPSPAPATPARTKNTLTLLQVKLADWCRTCPDDCARKPYGDLASIAEATLKFTVTAANMSSMIEACEIMRIKPDAPPSLEEQLATLRDRLDKAEGMHSALRGTVKEILEGMAALTARVSRLELHQEQPVMPYPDLPGLPVPAWFEKAHAEAAATDSAGNSHPAE